MMLKKLLARFGAGGRKLRALRIQAEACRALAPQMREKPEGWFPRRMEELRRMLAGMPETERFKALDGLRPEVFAAAAEAARRKLGLEMHFEQLMGACALHLGWVAEMKTGEGKTLAAVPAAVLHALTGDPVFIATANGYLAGRDAEWNGPVYAFLGLTCGSVQAGMPDSERQDIYLRDVVYGTGQEFGFDWLRDNMKVSLEDMVQRGLGFALVDEADSLLIDEARTPLVISGPGQGTERLWLETDKAVKALSPEDWICDEKARTAVLADSGVEKIESMFGVESLYAPENALLQHHVLQSLRAMALFRRDRDYIVKDGEVLAVDELTGRVLPGRRWSDGLHQAVEAKEGLAVRPETRTEACVSFQNFFRQYRKLSGMTGTADSSAVELKQIYGLETCTIPTHRPMIRKDLPDRIYMTAREKFSAVCEEVRRLHEAGRPVLVGTSSVEVSDALSRRLAREGLAHEVLNAREHAREAEIMAKAGQSGRITVATNMAGRGVDIMLDNAARKAGGLAVVGTEHAESRRADDQLRGRSGRQGDPGSSCFFTSLEDPLPRLFGSAKLKALLLAAGAGGGQPLSGRGIARACSMAQQKVEEMQFETRKSLMDYDEALNLQRDVVYAMRRSFMNPETAPRAAMEEAGAWIDAVLEGAEGAVLEDACRELEDVFALPEESLGMVGGLAEIKGFCLGKIEAKRGEAGEHAGDAMGRIFLGELDACWRTQLRDMEALRDGIGLRSYSRLDPKTEYKKAAWELFQAMLARARSNGIRVLCHAEFECGGMDGE